MKPRRIFTFVLVIVLGGLFGLLQSCKKKETQPEPLYLTVDLPRSVMQNGLYYSLNYQERSVELDFSQTVDSSTVKGNISFSDKDVIPASMYTMTSYGRKIFIAFQPGFLLQDGWKYKITITTGLRSTSGVTFQSSKVIEIRTTARHLVLDNDTTKRNSIVCISDIHMGDPRSVVYGYCWFYKNAAALESLLNVVLTSDHVRQLVILGDLFDEWVVPYRISPFDSAAGINTSRDYFLSIANSAVNINVINKLKAIASSGAIQLIYVPGNHDMLLTQDILQEIIPGVIWKGDSSGLGHYSPLSEMIMEHGHRYDFFNCPQPLSNQGHILPPGYFISRLDAEGLMEHGSLNRKELKAGSGQIEFLAAWTAAFEYLKIQYSLTVAADSSNILMGGIDNYSSTFSFNGVRDMYSSNIEDVWPSTETRNAVPVTMPVLMAILNGSLDLSFTAAYEYMQPTVPNLFKIVAFGHTHNPMLKVYPLGKQYTGIYANTGSWVNADLCSKPVRTFLVIKPGEWTGSDLDVVSLFQYNLDSGSGNPNPDYIPILISEESIDRGN
ncbi:MAG: metallophosphoesterase [Bacteroidetes bacterium]|nr:metallophosphoesterase [Bacteroidota bacterium]